MARRLTEEQKDDRKIEAAVNFVSATNDWKIAQKTYGPFSQQSQDALTYAEYALKQFKRYNK